MDQESFAGGAWGDAASGAYQETLTEFLFEQGDLPTEAGLRQVEGNCGATEAAAVSDGDERLELPEFHEES